ncbi:LytR/AlgR family response regulator transcription factor [Chitinophaga pinensis]|uniref:Two component transcriptional regulator, LytTR family n=1 Tax=Chitinophaga pinensis (strain ATCC 43595 / DSM 2588 / LMG 13176 / NBRC 15968 / NCIMB 11800 / UQM 2034) TaxID=485918 RepID=A0A979GAF8_CHIPD|nr:LytTR family DNA-binding domain-containing protein [Chitinophaga pinensis]ACU63810.1 two component transcriptional regulator, LytTR family [Chitinophaga pinensis DSM 2588]
MQVVIIEDEALTAEDLRESILKLDDTVQVTAMLKSVKEAVAYFRTHEMPDLIFSDIQLGDGESFDIYRTVEVTAPIIFCTAYDEYALQAFKANGIEYILKPFTDATIADALRKYNTLRRSFAVKETGAGNALDAVFEHAPKPAAILVHYKDKIVPVRLDSIVLFYIEKETLCLMTFDRQHYYLKKSLEEAEQLCGDVFFRVNRQFLVNRKAIKDASHYLSRKLCVNLNVSFREVITVSKEKTPQFLSWLGER